ncbi:LacI family DNA-binding transcriptional regulator [Timonella senegalensis]|uniref:LacI family DNA-binding transcriptional regulator n=3 Tax=Timonella senegalensis TaxID=1465825 RepID=UPI002FE11911
MNTSRSSLKDVAARAGVSTATASKALNGRSDVSEATRRKVHAAAQDLDFVPNELARSIAVRQTGTLGLLTHDLEGRFSLPILMGAEDAAGAGQMSVFLCDSRGDAIREQHHLKALASRRIDGLIVVGGDTDPRKSLGRNLGIPIVYAYAPSTDESDMSVIPDNYQGGRDVTTHLLATGRSKIAHITGVDYYSAAQDRAQGVADVLDAQGLSLVGSKVFFGEWSEQWGRTAAHALVDKHPEVDAIIAGSDMIARGVLDALRERGVDVPGKVAVTGYDNWQPLIAGARPSLTSVDMNFELVGRRAAEKLMGAIAGTVEPGIERLRSTLVQRGSTEIKF